MVRLVAVAALGLLVLSAGFVGTPVARAQDGVDGLHLLGRNEHEFAHMMDFQVVGDYAYASVGLSAGFQSYDITDPANPIWISTIGFPGWRATVSGNTAYNFQHGRGVQVFDISSGAALLMGSYDPQDNAVSYEGGDRVGDLLYVAAHQVGIEILDVGTPGSIAPTSRILLANNACWNLVESGGHLYIANGRFGLSIVDLSGTPTEVGSLPLLGLANDIEIDGDVVFLSLAGDGIASVNVSDPSNPVLLDRATTFGNAFSMGLVGDMLGVGSYPYVERFDVSNPSAIERSGWDASLVYAMGADVGVTSAGDTVIVVADWRGMAVYEAASDVAGDIEVYPTRLDVGRIETTADTTVVVRNNGLGSLEIASVSAPTLVTVNPSAFVLGPGESQIVTVTVGGSTPIRSTIRYFSDDPDEAESVQHIYANNTTFPQMGSEAPDFTLMGTDGSSHTLSDYRGKVVYLEFGASW